MFRVYIDNLDTEVAVIDDYRAAEQYVAEWKIFYGPRIFFI